ncbi:hypothetical protein NM688_g2395 [Phlebia brevispora]|uniref:Uncharacterized protein n=1 Tax=Phlebia brevispora TaxID=194682 RepID=A0ACC1T8F8_9APHY|nr:hypothetical protein NM688_g2395 [Phlebia brevispora]
MSRLAIEQIEIILYATVPLLLNEFTVFAQLTSQSGITHSWFFTLVRITELSKSIFKARTSSFVAVAAVIVAAAVGVAAAAGIAAGASGMTRRVAVAGLAFAITAASVAVRAAFTVDLSATLSVAGIDRLCKGTELIKGIELTNMKDLVLNLIRQTEIKLVLECRVTPASLRRQLVELDDEF